MSEEGDNIFLLVVFVEGQSHWPPYSNLRTFGEMSFASSTARSGRVTTH
jgi:hypothetical protein